MHIIYVVDEQVLVCVLAFVSNWLCAHREQELRNDGASAKQFLSDYFPNYFHNQNYAKA